jgi:biopolymer transport protein ExbD
MAEIQSDNSSKRKGTKGKKLSTRVDLTPMVDLGFLLITFFIFTTTMSSPTAMRLIVPDDSNGPDISTAKGKTLNLLLSANDNVYYYEGDDPLQMKVADYSQKSLRQIILNKKKSVAEQYGNGSEMVVLIKPSDEANYKNIVDALDEMKINDVAKFVLMDATTEEKQLLAVK